MESDWEIMVWLLKYFKGQEITTFKSPTFPRQQSVMTEHLVLVVSLFIFFFFSVFVWAVRVEMPKWESPIGLDRITTAGMLPFGQSSIHLWSSLWIRHLWLGIRSVSGSLRRHLVHPADALSLASTGLSVTLSEISAVKSALLQASGRQALADSSLKVAPDCSLIS